MSAGTVEETEAHHLNAISIHFCVQILQMHLNLKVKGKEWLLDNFNDVSLTMQTQGWADPVTSKNLIFEQNT